MSRLIPLFYCVTILISIFIGGCGQNYGGLTAELTPEEASMPEAKYYTTEFAPIPDEVMDGLALGSVSKEKTLPFEKINFLTKPGNLPLENGYSLLDDGTAYVAVRTLFPGATKEMIPWWFWWHALEDIRYKIWCPGAHYAIGAADTDQLTDERLSGEERYLNNPQYPIEDIGSGTMRLTIRFVSPECFGFDTSKFSENGIAAVICGVVGFKVGEASIEHSYVCHVFREMENGLELRSRFWLGEKLNMPNIRKLVITEDLAMDMLLHCSQEFNHLADFLPSIYNEFANQH